MTLQPEQIGDKGQRYLVQAKGWPDHKAEDWQDCIYANDLPGAEKVEKALTDCPGVTETRIVDRWMNEGIAK